MKVWSISTTLRTPDRTKNFLLTLKEMEGKIWNSETQKEFQVRLIKNRFYGSEKTQFLNNLSEENKGIMNDLKRQITLEEAWNIFSEKSYEDPAMRGRTSFAPLKELGLAKIDNSKITITSSGNLLLKNKIDFGDLLLKIFLKWQYPNPITPGFKENYNTKPFITTMHLIKKVNILWENEGFEPIGISKFEFSIFVLSLLDYNNISEWANRLLEFRKNIRKKQINEQIIYYREFCENFLANYENATLENLKDYTDNAIRYFRMTKYFYIRGNGFYIDLEPRREIEINSILENWNGSSDNFTTRRNYQEYIENSSLPELPWENIELLIEIKDSLIGELERLEFTKLEDINITTTNIETLNDSISKLREIRRSILDQKQKLEYSTIENIDRVMDELKNIRKNDILKPSVALEKWTTIALDIINDCIKIKANYPVGDDNEPTFTAAANRPDIECYYDSFNAICEVTLLTGRNQWFNEGQPVMRHLRDFENNSDKEENYAIFIAPSLHRDTLNTFWVSIKYEYEGRKQKIIPLEIKELIEILEVIKEKKRRNSHFTHSSFQLLLEKLSTVTPEITNSLEWRNKNIDSLKQWKEEIIL